MRHFRRRLGTHDDDPLSGVANLFDLGIILSLAFMVAALARAPLAAPAAAGDRQARSAAGAAVPTEADRLERLQSTAETRGGEGERLGVAYRLKSGEVVYVPEAAGKETGRREKREE